MTRRHLTPETAIRNAQDTANVLRCVEPDGTLIDHRYLDGLLPDRWVRLTSDDPSIGAIVPTPAVKDRARDCDPDVRVIPEIDSLFEQAGDRHD